MRPRRHQGHQPAVYVVGQLAERMALTTSQPPANYVGHSHTLLLSSQPPAIQLQAPVSPNLVALLLLVVFYPLHLARHGMYQKARQKAT